MKAAASWRHLLGQGSGADGIAAAEVPRGLGPLAQLLDLLAAGSVSSNTRLPSVLVGRDQALVLERLKRRVHRAGAGCQRPPLRSEISWIIW